MKKEFLILVGFTLIASFAFAENTNIDLSGKWLLTPSGENREQGNSIQPSELLFVATPFKTEAGDQLYLVEGSVGEMSIWGASVRNHEGKIYLVTYALRGERFDDEYSIILGSSETQITLGGDFEEYEVAKMTKIASPKEEL